MKQVLAAVVLMLMPNLVHAEGFYVGAQGGVNFLSSHFLKSNHCTFDTGYNVSAVAGYVWCPKWRLEAEIAFRENHYHLHGRDNDGDKDTFHGKVRTWSLMANGYYDIPLYTDWCITPYLGAGIGADRVRQCIRIDGENYKGSHIGFAWQLMAGLSRSFCRNMVLSTEYKFHVSPLRNNHHLQNQSVTLILKRFF